MREERRIVSRMLMNLALDISRLGDNEITNMATSTRWQGWD